MHLVVRRAVPAALAFLDDAHGFLLRRRPGGPVTAIDVPGGAVRTIALGINDRGQIVGTYERSAAGPDAPRALRLDRALELS